MTVKSSPTTTATSVPTASPSPTAKPMPTVAPVSFAGKTVTVIVPFAPGGGTDLAGRLYAKYLKEYLPGKPIVVVRNMPGGEAILASNYAYTARPDGLTVLAAGGGTYMGELLEKPAVKYSMTKMTALAASPASSAMLTKSTVVDKPENIRNARGLIWGSATGGVAYLFAITVEMFGFQTEKVVMAYESSGEARRAFLSGEINAVNATATVYDQIKAQVKAGDVTLLYQTGHFNDAGELVQSPVFPPDCLTPKGLYEKVYGKSPSGMAWDAYVAIVATRSFDKPLMLPPGASDDIKKVYWNAVKEMVKDPSFLKTTQDLYGESLFVAGESFDAVFKSKFGIKPEIREYLAKVMAKYGATLE